MKRIAGRFTPPRECSPSLLDVYARDGLGKRG